MEAPQTFIESFIKPSMHGRLSHEWKNKPGELLERVCHNADSLFIESSKGNESAINQDEQVYVVTTKRVQQMSYCEAEAKIWHGDGSLIVSIDGRKFVAESECTKDSVTVTYAGNLL